MASSVQKINLMMVLGSEGTYRREICVHLQEVYDYVRVSVNAVWDDAKNDPHSPYHQIVVNHDTAGTRVPEDVTCKLMLYYMRQSPNKKYFIDDYPVHPFHLYAVTDFLAPFVKISTVFYLTIPLDVALARAAAEEGDRDELLGVLSQYLNDVTPVVEYYRDKGLLKILDSTKSTDALYQDVKISIEAINCRGDF